jgi:hypothetical protein
MSAASDALRDFMAPLLPGWQLQFGRWEDLGRDKRYAVIRPAGGLPVEVIREPQFTTMFIGADGEGSGPASDAVDSVVEAMRASSGSLVFLQPAEPVYVASDDGRAIFELAVSAITN